MENKKPNKSFIDRYKDLNKGDVPVGIDKGTQIRSLFLFFTMLTFLAYMSVVVYLSMKLPATFAYVSLLIFGSMYKYIYRALLAFFKIESYDDLSNY